VAQGLAGEHGAGPGRKGRKYILLAVCNGC
jgi:hypothetical protein